MASNQVLDQELDMEGVAWGSMLACIAWLIDTCMVESLHASWQFFLLACHILCQARLSHGGGCTCATQGQNICIADLKDSFFVGDAAGRVGDFAASDK